MISILSVSSVTGHLPPVPSIHKDFLKQDPLPVGGVVEGSTTEEQAWGLVSEEQALRLAGFQL